MKVVNLHIILLLITGALYAQNDTVPKFKFSGQVSTYGNYNFSNDLDVLLGGNCIPELSYSLPFKNKTLLDFELSANAYGSMNFRPFDTLLDNGDVQAYRGWARYSGEQFEIRAGLQKINFGSATILRPLRWFDQVDPRDPLGLTPGVWGLLGRYYFLNNANIWLWGLYGNEDPKGWEAISTYEQIPELGGRFQHPVPKGELAVSYHHRTADSRNLGIDSLAIAKNPENRFGLDGKWDVGVGLWFEASQTIKQKKIGPYTNQTLLSVGIDYTFGIGSGLNVVGEHLIAASYESSPDFSDAQNLSAITASYPIGMFDNLSTVIYYDWYNNGLSTFLNYQRDLRLITLYIMVYLNPEDERDIQQNDLVNNYNGKGVQVMLVYDF